MLRPQCVLVIALLIELANSWDIAVTAGDRIEFYNDDGTKTATVHLKSQNLTALVYDEVHNMLLYVDKQSDKDSICGYNMTSLEYKCYIERIGSNIHGLAFDPVTETLFFTDIKERSINSFSFKNGSQNNVTGDLLIKLRLGFPTDIAVDSCRGYIYFIHADITPTRIERARFNGSERVVVISAKHKTDLHSLAIDKKTQKLYSTLPGKTNTQIYSSDLDGQNRKGVFSTTYKVSFIHPNVLSVSKSKIYAVHWCLSCSAKPLWRHPIPALEFEYSEPLFEVQTESVVAIAANYKMRDQFQGISDCDHVLNKYEPGDSFNITRQYEGPFCGHGTKVTGQSLCECTPGYTGERCGVPVCENYCVHGNCSFSDDGLPKCRCEAGYSGERCEVNVCYGYCSNNGTCSMNEDSQPSCQCQGDYVGHRCETSGCVNYCLNGNCSFNEQGLPHCRCEAGYSGERCEVSVCDGHCLNNGTCSLNEEYEPVCNCVGEYEGGRCEVPGGLNNGNDETACQCVGNHEGSGRESDENQTTNTNT